MQTCCICIRSLNVHFRTEKNSTWRSGLLCRISTFSTVLFGCNANIRQLVNITTHPLIYKQSGKWLFGVVYYKDIGSGKSHNIHTRFRATRCRPTKIISSSTLQRNVSQNEQFNLLVVVNARTVPRDCPTFISEIRYVKCVNIFVVYLILYNQTPEPCEPCWSGAIMCKTPARSSFVIQSSNKLYFLSF